MHLHLSLEACKHLWRRARTACRRCCSLTCLFLPFFDSFFGHLITGTIALALTYLPGNLLPLELRQLLTSSIAISVMMKLGVPCPPAAAFGLIYARGNHSWRFFGFTLICILVSFIPAMAINNLNPRRQYPTFWGYSPRRLARIVREGLCFCKDKERSKHAK